MEEIDCVDVGETDDVVEEETVSAFSIVQGLVDKSPKETIKSLKAIYNDITLNCALEPLIEAADQLVRLNFIVF